MNTKKKGQSTMSQKLLLKKLLKELKESKESKKKKKTKRLWGWCTANAVFFATILFFAFSGITFGIPHVTLYALNLFKLFTYLNFVSLTVQMLAFKFYYKSLGETITDQRKYIKRAPYSLYLISDIVLGIIACCCSYISGHSVWGTLWLFHTLFDALTCFIFITREIDATQSKTKISSLNKLTAANMESAVDLNAALKTLGIKVNKNANGMEIDDGETGKVYISGEMTQEAEKMILEEMSKKEVKNENKGEILEEF